MSRKIDVPFRPMKKYVKIAGRLRQLREGLSQRSFAEKIGIPYRSYRRYESGERVPTIDVLLKIADACNTRADWLFTGKGETLKEVIPASRDELLRDIQILEILRDLRDKPESKKLIYKLLRGGRKEREALIELQSRLKSEELERYEILSRLALPSDIFDIKGEGDIIETQEMKTVHRNMEEAIKTSKNLAVLGGIGTGKTVLLKSFLRKRKNSLKIAQPHFISEDYRIYEFYDCIILDIGVAPKSPWRLDEREFQARKVLQQIAPEPAVFIIDDAHWAKVEALKQLISFQQSPDIKNLSIILFGHSSLPKLPQCEIVMLKGLSPKEISIYIKLVSKKSGEKLPVDIPISAFKGIGNFFDVQDKYLTYAWENLSKIR